MLAQIADLRLCALMAGFVFKYTDEKLGTISNSWLIKIVRG